MKLSAIVFLISAVTSSLGADENRKNHAPEKRQDSSYLFGGWTPIKPGSPFYHGKTDLLSLDEDGLDAASTFYSSLQHKDIYSYYPRPAIKARPKPNTPVYTESLTKRGHPPQKYDRGHQIEPHLSVAAFKDFPIEQLKGLHEAFVAAHPLRLPAFNLGSQRGKNAELLEIAVHPIQEIVSEVKSATYDAFPQGRHYAPPQKQGYASAPSHNRVKPHFSRRPLKPAPIVPVPLAHIPESDIFDIKNIQIVEYPVQAVPLQPVPNGKAPGGGRYNRQRQKTPLILPQGRGSSPRLPSKLELGQEIVFRGPTHQSRYPAVHDYSSDSSFQTQGKFEYGVPEQAIKLDYEQHPQVSTELIKVSDEQIKTLLKTIQIVDKTSKDIFTYVPVDDVQNKKKVENLHLLVAVPQEQILHSGVAPPNKQRPTGYESDYDHGSRANDVQSYGSPEVNEYHHEQKTERPKPSKQSYGAYQTKGHSGEVTYQAERHHNQGSVSGHQPSKYQEQNQYAEEPAAEHQPGGYQQDQGHSDGPAIVHTGKYIEVTSSHTGEDGYKREPILALELKEGQSVEEAIKALDPETLQKLGAYSKDGLEIEIVEVPDDDEYSSESRKRETAVPQPKRASGGKKRLRATVRSSKKLS